MHMHVYLIYMYKGAEVALRPQPARTQRLHLDDVPVGALCLTDTAEFGKCDAKVEVGASHLAVERESLPDVKGGAAV